MEVNLQELNYKDEIIVNEKINIPEEMIENTEIIKLGEVLVNGNIRFDYDEEYIIKLDVTGQMTLHDALTFDEVPYDFVVNIEEKLENSCKSIDLIEFLWHYIVLEIPLRYTTSSEVDVRNDDYQIISEEEYNNNNNPFKDFFKE